MIWKAAITIALLGGVGAGVSLYYRNTRPEPVPDERIISVQLGDIARSVIAIGRVEPRTRMELKSKANGIIRRLHVDVNDPVRAGQVIVELDKEILEAGVAEAEGKLKQAQAAVDQAVADIKRLEVERDDPEVAFARRNSERVERLYKEGVASEDERDLARERIEKAEYRIRLLESQIGVARSVQESAEGRRREMQALADLARQELQEATIVSPIDGVVLYRYLEEGDSVSSIRVAGGNATTIMTLGDLSELYVDGQVDEVDVGKIISEQRVRPDLIARVTVESHRQRKFIGRVVRITPLGLEDSNGIVTFEVRIVLENPEKLLLANMTATALILLEEKKNVPVLSQGALITEGKNRFALVYDPASGRSIRREIGVGITDGSLVEITQGLEPGARVVIP